MGERYYDPSLGRFTQQDPINSLIDPMQWNRYVYVGDNPVNYIDPTGLGPWGCLGKSLVGGLLDILSGSRGDPSTATSLAVFGGAVLAKFSWTAVGAGLAAGDVFLMTMGSLGLAAGVALVGYGLWKGIQECF